MPTPDPIQQYIQATIIDRLQSLMDNTSFSYPHLRPVPKDSAYRSHLHILMLPYYKMYLTAQPPLCKPNMEPIRYALKSIIDDDPQFGSWASSQDLIASAHHWGDNLKLINEEKRIFQYFYLLHNLLASDCAQDWLSLSAQLKQLLFTSQVYSDYKTDEVLCVLHAFSMIMQQDWPKQQKADTLELLRNHWLFMKHYYSVMTRHLVGVKWTSFIDDAKTVLNSSQKFRPHLHIYYCGLIDIADSLLLDRKHQRKFDNLIIEMQNTLQRTEPSTILYNLCDTLFPEDFQRLIRDHRPKSYKEVEDENRQKELLLQQLNSQYHSLQGEFDKTQQLFQRLIQTAIPIERIDAELMKYPPSMSWDLLCNLNQNPALNAIESWHNAYPALLAKYRERLTDDMNKHEQLSQAIKTAAERPTNSYTYSAGATHQDHRQQILIDNDRANTLQQKLPINE